MINSHLFIVYGVVDEEADEIVTYNAWINVALDENADVDNTETAIRTSLMEKHNQRHDIEIGFYDFEIMSITKLL